MGKKADPNGVATKHRTSVLPGDSISAFKDKLSQAILELETAATTPEQKRKYRDAYITPEHVVTVFQPSDSLRKALNKSKDGEGKEIEKLRTEEEEDPSNWVPLDPLRTFGHYPHLFMQSADDPTPVQNRQSADDPTPVKN